MRLAQAEAEETQVKLNAERLRRRLTRAHLALGQGIRYKLGYGGMDPSRSTPAESRLLYRNRCDCSGYVAWCLGLSRKPKPYRPWWIETTNVYRDAVSARRVFRIIPEPVPGCVVVFGDYTRNGIKHEGHIGLVVGGGEDDYRVIDCTGKGITVHDGDYFRKHHAIFAVLNEDVLAQ